MFFPSTASPYADGSVSLDPYLWQQHFDLLRTQRPVLRAEVSEAYEELYRQFRWMLRQSKDVLADPALQQRNCPVLSQAGERMLDLHRICYSELQRFESPDSEPLVPPAELYQLMEAGQDLTDRIRQQIASMHLVCNYAMELREFILILLHQGNQLEDQIGFESLDRLLKRMRMQKHPGSLESHLHPLPHIAIEWLTAKFSDPYLARSLVTGIITTLNIQRVAGMSWLNESQLQLAGAAGLLQDCGWFVIRSERNPIRRDSEARNNTYDRCRQHPVVGGALVGGILNAPPLLARLVSQHHERINGTGFPRGVRETDLSPLARLISAGVRLEELRIAQDGLAMFLSAGPRGESEAVRTLIHEARKGDFDTGIVHKLLRDYDDSLPLQEWWNERLIQPAQRATHLPHTKEQVLQGGIDHLLAEQRQRSSMHLEH